MKTLAIAAIEQDFCHGAVYPASRQPGAFMLRGENEDVLVAEGALGFSGETFETAGKTWTLAPLTHENAVVLRKVFPFTAPVPVLREKRTIGLGDRLGLATPGHIQALRPYDICPVFAQQSIRELNLTGRNYEDVLDCASFAVFREGYTGGFGADGDHLKTPEEVQYAIDCGYTMITLDCSEHIRNDVGELSDEAALLQYEKDEELERLYLGKTFTVEDAEITFTPMEFVRICLIYNKAIDFAVRIYDRFFRGDTALDFEISIDETMTPTTPAQHFYVASELLRRGVKPQTVAPRFCGEFQKGIDYIGDIRQFNAEFDIHAKIARHFGYKISVHSGSDKFSVFESVGRYTLGNFHIKTAGTNWLEAMAVIAEKEPSLYREIHQYALDTAFDEAKKYYHVTTNLGNIPPLNTLTDAQLPGLFENNDARQLIHITYGLILGEKNPDGTDRFRSRLYAAWRSHETEYSHRLQRHIGRHLATLYRGFEE